MGLALAALWLSVACAGAPRWAGVVSSLVKVRPGVIPELRGVARLSLARGECQGFQVVAAPPAAGVNAKLYGLESLAVRVYREAYLDVREPSGVEGARGPWPDPLVPVTDAYEGEARAALPFDSTEARPLVLYVEVCADARRAPGSAAGSLALSAADRPPVKVPIEVRVLRFALPATSSFPTSFGLSLYSVARGHRLDSSSAEARRLLRDYATALLAHRLSAYGMGMDAPPVRFEAGNARVDFTDYDAELGPFLDGTALPSGARFTTTDARDTRAAVTDSEKVLYLRAVRAHHEQRGWLARLFFYAKDEPRPADFPLVLKQSARARAAGAIAALVTSSPDEALGSAADILCPNMTCFFPRAGAQTCRRVMTADELRRALPGTALWWYQSCTSHGCGPVPPAEEAWRRATSGWASYLVDVPAPRNRAMGPLAFLAGVEGELYFDTVHAYGSRDAWEDVFEFGGNGDGTLFYPGTPARVGGRTHVPIESLRLKHIRDGLTDYEYLHLADALGARPFAQAMARRLAKSGYEVTLDAAEWEAVRGALADRLEALWQPTKPGR